MCALSIKTKILEQQCLFGTWSVFPSPIVADVIARSGVDFIIFDREHGSVSHETLFSCISVCELHKVSPFVRVPGVIEGEILKALDLGAAGLHVPNITSKEEAELLVRYAKYPPNGNRGFSPFTRAGGFSAGNGKALLTGANSEIVLMIHIEGREAIEQIEDFFKIDEIDGIFIGIYDLSKSLGLEGNVHHPEIKKTLKYIGELGKKYGKIVGTIATEHTQAMEYIEYGIRYITFSVDCDMLLSIYRATFSRLKE